MVKWTMEFNVQASWNEGNEVKNVEPQFARQDVRPVTCATGITVV